MSASARTIVRYLLGEMSDSAQAALESEDVGDPRLFDKMVKTENQLVDAYARGRLSPRLRVRFERAYLADPRRRERVKFAEAFAARLDRVERPRVALRRRPLIVGLAMAAVLLLVTAAGIRWFMANRRVHQEMVQTAPPPVVDPRPQPTPPAPSPPQPIAAPTVVTLLLAVSDVRAADTRPPATLVVPPGTEQVRIELRLKERDYPGYNVTLRAVGGAEILSRLGVTPETTGSGAVLVMTVPARELATGDYILTVNGVRPGADIVDVSRSIFHVDKK